MSTFCTIWSPNGNHFLCDGENDEDPSVNGVYTIRSSDGGGLTRITSATGGGGDDLPIDYSPDGSRIVFGHTGPFHTCDKTSALFVVNIDGTGLHRITPWGFCDDDGSWSPDGSTIAFARDDGFIFSVHPDGSGLQQVPLSSVPRCQQQPHLRGRRGLVAGRIEDRRSARRSHRQRQFHGGDRHGEQRRHPTSSGPRPAPLSTINRTGGPAALTHAACPRRHSPVR